MIFSGVEFGYQSLEHPPKKYVAGNEDKVTSLLDSRRFLGGWGTCVCERVVKFFLVVQLCF